jgi:hypothetical protein
MSNIYRLSLSIASVLILSLNQGNSTDLFAGAYLDQDSKAHVSQLTNVVRNKLNGNMQNVLIYNPDELHISLNDFHVPEPNFHPIARCANDADANTYQQRVSDAKSHANDAYNLLDDISWSITGIATYGRGDNRKFIVAELAPIFPKDMALGERNRVMALLPENPHISLARIDIPPVNGNQSWHKIDQAYKAASQKFIDLNTRDYMKKGAKKLNLHISGVSIQKEHGTVLATSN